jgi:thioredoxin reductase
MLIDARGRARSTPDGLFACGDVLADRPRAWLDAFATGANAGANAVSL